MFQFCFSHVIDTIFPIPSATPIIATATGVAENIVINPIIEKYSLMIDKNRPDSKVGYAKYILFRFTIIKMPSMHCARRSLFFTVWAYHCRVITGFTFLAKGYCFSPFNRAWPGFFTFAR